jgi:hypothetical protein
VLTSLKAAPGKTAPLGSTTVTEMLPPVAAWHGNAATIDNAIARLARRAQKRFAVEPRKALSIVYLMH